MSTTITATPANVVVDATELVNDANTVVLHDMSAFIAATQQLAVNPYAELTALVAEKQDWEANAYRTSNEQLYRLLQKCYALYKLICSQPAKAKALVEEVDRFISESGSSINASTHTLSKIVKCVFGADRRRVSAYSLALQTALAADVRVADIPDYIRNAGGVEELRLAKSPNAMTAKGKAQTAAYAVVNSEMGHIKLDALSQKLDGAKVGTQHVLIVTQGVDGAFTINALVSAPAAVNAALAAYYTANKKQLEGKVVEQQQTDANANLNTCIAAAAAAVLQ